MTNEVCANCGSPVALNRYNKPVCLRCGTMRKDGSALAPSPETIDQMKRELKERAIGKVPRE